MFQDSVILKIGHRPFRKLLWLIPFTLAKKLLTCLPPVAKNNFASTLGGPKARGVSF